MSGDPQQIDRRVLLQNAMAAVDKLQAKLDAVERAKSEPIAIIGLSCRFPGGANSPEAYWELLQNGRDVISRVPAGRWAVDVESAPELAGASWYGGFLDQVDQFDPQFFGIAPREAETMDPQQRLVLEASWEALERAGLPPDKLKGSRTGLFIGVTTNDYAQLSREGDPATMDVYTATGSALNVIPGRVAYTLGLQGPSMAVDTACSSSLVAVHLACQSLRSGESELALAGGVNTLLAPEAFVCFSKWGMMAPDGRCKTFDSRADGFVRGEGCGVIVLKRLSDALAAQDNILALILGSAVNQDGRSSGLTVPNGLAQQAVIRQALASARRHPAEISYVEAHGTGTSLGDPIEIEALAAVLGEGRAAEQPLAVASVKTNIGHLESAAGIAGLIKVVLAMQHRELPPHLHLQKRSPQIPWPNFPIQIPTERQPWAAPAGTRLAGVSAFGFSGTNAHVILQEAPQPEPVADQPERPVHVLTLSAKTEPALRQLAARLGQHLAGQPAIAPGDVAYTVNTGRVQFNHRLAVAAASTAEFSQKLTGWSTGQSPAGLVSGQPAVGSQPRIAFLFTGQGAQYAQMARQLYQTQPFFRRILEQCDELLRPYLLQPLLSVLYPEAGQPPLLDETAYTQPALFAIEYALAELWRLWGVKPAVVLGHSVGEYVAAAVAGVFSLEDGLKLIAERGRLMQALPAGGKMAAVFAAEAQVRAAVVPFAQSVAVAAINGPENIVISGAGEAVQTILANLAAEGIKAQPLVVSHAFHSPLMEPMLADFGRAATVVKYSAPHLGLISNVTGQMAGPEVATAAYWQQHVLAPVQFAGGIQALAGQDIDAFLEIGPKPTLLSLARRCLPDDNRLWLPSLRAGRADWEQMLDSLLALHARGQEIDWTGFEQGYPRRHRLPLPTYPFQRRRYWLEPKTAKTTTTQPAVYAGKSGRHPLLGARLDLAAWPGTYVWQGQLDLKHLSFFNDHRVQDTVIFPATGYIEIALAAAAEVWGPGPVRLTEIENKKALLLSEAMPPLLLQITLAPAADGAMFFQIFSRPDDLGQNGSPPQPWTLHVTGNISQIEAAAISPPLFTPEDVQARCPEKISGEAFYRQLAEKGNQWGPCFQGVDQLWRGVDEAVSLVRVPAQLEAGIDAYQFHPAVADACGHVLVATGSLERTDGVQGGAVVGGGIAEARWYKQPQGRQLWAYARLRREEHGDQNILLGDVQVVDETGALVSETLGTRLWYLDRQAQQNLLENSNDWFYELRWEPAEPLAVQTPGGNGQSGWLIFADSQGTGAAIGATLQAQGERCLLVFAGEQYERRDEHHFWVRANQAGDFERLFQEIAGLNRFAVSHVVHLWSLDAPAPENTTPATLEMARKLGCESALYLIQALARHPWQKPPRVWLVSRGAQAVGVESRPVAVAQAPLWGFGRSLALEQPELQCVCVDLDPAGNSDDNNSTLFQTIWTPTDENQIAFRGGKPYVARLARSSERITTVGKIINSASTYLITGGLGGLGLMVARWLVDKGARYLVLTGRSGAQGAARTAVTNLEQAGAQVIVVQADVSQHTDMARLLLDIEQTMPPLRGVIHAAGVLDDGVLLQQTWPRFEKVMAPKIEGAWQLHSLTQHLPLDFFVMFSAGAALFGSMGQANYAAANSFLDGLAHYRRQQGLPALSINWGGWAEVGMAAALPEWEKQRWLAQGINLIDPTKGINTLAQLMFASSPQVAVLPIDWPIFTRQLGQTKPPFLSGLLQPAGQLFDNPVSGTNNILFYLQSASPTEQLELLVGYLQGWVRDVIKLDSTTILDSSQPLNEFGLDSLMALELKNRIETNLGVVIPMVQFLQGPSTEQLAQLLLSKLTIAATVSLPAENGQTGDDLDQNKAAQLLANLDQLSDEQVDLLLADLLEDETS